MVLRIFKYGEKILREKAEPVGEITGEMRRLAADMLETMYASKGVGLAAGQVGRRERLCVIDVPKGCDDEETESFNAPVPMPLVMFNPTIVAREGSVRDKEGCLSFPGIGGSIVRAERVSCQFTGIDGKPQIVTARGYLARAIQHETDHLDGVLYVDHMTAVERLGFSGKLKKLAKANGGRR